jgi:hypothetical protein
MFDYFSLRLCSVSCFLSLVISIVAGAENFNYFLVGVLCGIGIVFLMKPLLAHKLIF